MLVKTQEIGQLRFRYDFKVPTTVVNTEYDKIYTEFKDKVTVKGFRTGTAPREVVFNHLGPQLKAEIASRLIYSEVEAAIKEKQIEIVGSPAVTVDYQATKAKPYAGFLNLDGSFDCAVEAEVPPSIIIKDYEGVEIDLNLPDPEQWVEARIKEYQKTFAEKAPVERPIQAGDEITIDYSSRIGDEVIADAHESWRAFVVGSGEFMPDFDKNFIGKNVGDVFEFSVDFTEGHPNTALLGKTLTVKAEIHSACSVNEPAVDDALAQLAVFENKEHMFAELRSKAEQEFIKPRRAKTLELIMDKILTANAFEVPQCWIDNEVNVVAHKLGFKQKISKDDEQYLTLREIAERSVKQSFVFDQIYKNHPTIHLQPADVENALAEEAGKMNKSSAEYLAWLKASGNYEGFISYREQQQAVDFLIKSAKIKEVK